MKEKNIIQKTIIDFEFNARVDGFELQAQTDDWCRGKLLPAIEEILDNTDTQGIFVKIDKLEVVVDAKSKNWLHQLEKQIGEQLSKKLSEHLQFKKPGTKKTGAELILNAQTREENFFEVLIHFLQKGYLPWWSGINSKEEFSSELSLWLQKPATAEMRERTYELLKDENVQQRISHQFSREEFTGFIIYIHPEIRRELEIFVRDVFVIMQVISAQENIVEKHFRKLLINQVIKTSTLNFIQKAAEEIALSFVAYPEIFSYNFKRPKELKSTILITELKKVEKSIAILPEHEKKLRKEELKEDSKLWKHAAKEQSQLIDDADEGMYINNAGLVIVAPFLPFFLKKLGLIEQDKLVNTDLAVNLVSYIASGKENCGEFELCLAKILCGVEMETPVATDFYFTAQQKDKVNDLLLSIIEYWEILKDTSLEGLRESFLQRDGKLFFKNDEWQLQVEQKPYDMLLGSLSWNINLIKLSWMQYLLRTEWVF